MWFNSAITNGKAGRVLRACGILDCAIIFSDYKLTNREWTILSVCLAVPT